MFTQWILQQESFQYIGYFLPFMGKLNVLPPILLEFFFNGEAYVISYKLYIISMFLNWS